MAQNDKNVGKNAKQPNFTVQDEIRRNRRIRRMGAMRKMRSRAKSFLTVLICVAIGVLLVAAIGITVTRVKTVSVIGNERYTSDEILGAAKLDGEVMPLLTKRGVYRRIVEACPYVESVELIKEYPSTLTVNVIETEARYAVHTRGRTLTLDRDLRVMDYTEETEGLIVLTLPEIKSAVEGKQIVFSDEDALSYVTDLLSQFLTEETMLMTSLDITDKFDLTGKSGEFADISFGDCNNIQEKLIVVKQLIEDAKEEYAKHAVIDVSVLSQASLKLEY